MRESFKPLRKRIGVVTLLMACLLMVGWVRSPSFHDEVSFNGTELTESLSSHLGCIYWLRLRYHRSDNLPFVKAMQLAMHAQLVQLRYGKSKILT